MLKYRLLTPGPVPVPERVRQAMAGTLLHHRAPAFVPIMEEARANLRRVFQTAHDVLILASSGTGAMEAALANLSSPGDQAVVVRGGKFGERWAELCEAYGVVPICVDVEWGRAVQPAQVRAAFAANPQAKLLLVQASETSTGVFHPIRELAALVRESAERMIVVDGISGVGVHDLPMDSWGIDVMVSGSQKSWLLPPGLAFVALSPRAQEWLGRATQPRYYLDLRAELKAQRSNSTAYTPAVSLVAGLCESLRMILAEGLERVFARHELLARMTRHSMQAIGLELYAPDAPSFACTAVRVPPGVEPKKLLKHLQQRYGITLAEGQGKAASQIFRIGHMGDLDAFDTLAVIAAVEMSLADLGHSVPIGKGVQEAMEIFRASAHGGN
jgi:aspartate aminotransferase-like enzyme